MALFGVKEEEEETFFSIKNNINSKVSPIMPPLNLQVQTSFAKEFVQKLNRLNNNSNPTLDHVKLFYKVPWVVGTLYQLGIGS